MSDRELLEMAAKAAGIVGLWHERGQCIHVTNCAGMSDTWWRPLEDDGDALRLAAKLGFFLNTDSRGLGAHTIQGTRLQDEAHATAPECDEQNHMRLLRRCIVRAAAEIGRKMP